MSSSIHPSRELKVRQHPLVIPDIVECIQEDNLMRKELIHKQKIAQKLAEQSNSQL